MEQRPPDPSEKLVSNRQTISDTSGTRKRKSSGTPRARKAPAASPMTSSRHKGSSSPDESDANWLDDEDALQELYDHVADEEEEEEEQPPLKKRRKALEQIA